MPTTAADRLRSGLRDAQAQANRGHYPQAFGALERAVCRHLGISCTNCGGASTGDDRLCDGCREAPEKPKAKRTRK